MSRRSLTDLIGPIVLSGASILGCPNSDKSQIQNQVHADEADKVSDKKYEKSLKITIKDQLYTIKAGNWNYQVLDNSGELVTDLDLAHQGVFTYLVHKKVSEYDSKKLKQEQKKLDDLILKVQISKIFETGKKILGGENKIVGKINKPIGRAVGIGKETIESLIEISVDPKMYAIGSVIRDINETRDDYNKFIQGIEHSEPVSFNWAEDIFYFGVTTEPVNTSAYDGIDLLQDFDLRLDPEDKEVIKSLITLPQSVRDRETKRLAEKIEAIIKKSLIFHYYENEINLKNEKWDDIRWVVEELKPFEKEFVIYEPSELEIKGDYSTPEKAVLSDLQASKRGDTYEGLSNLWSKNLIDEKLGDDPLYLKKWEEEHEKAIKLEKESNGVIMGTRYKTIDKGEEIAYVIINYFTPPGSRYQSLECIRDVEWSEDENRWKPIRIELFSSPEDKDGRKRNEKYDQFIRDTYEHPKINRN